MSAGARARGADAGGGPPRAAGERKTKPQGPGGACQNTELCVTTLSTVVAASFFYNENELIENKAKRKEKANAYG